MVEVRELKIEVSVVESYECRQRFVKLRRDEWKL